MKIEFIKPQHTKPAKVSFEMSKDIKSKLDRMCKIENLSQREIIQQIIENVYEQNYSKQESGE